MSSTPPALSGSLSPPGTPPLPQALSGSLSPPGTPPPPPPLPPALTRSLSALAVIAVAGTVLALALFGAGRAAARGSGQARSGPLPVGPCSVATLQGPYGGLGSGTNVSSPLLPEGPLAVVNLIVFDGRGGLTVPVETMSFGGDVRRLTAPVQATYSVAPDCTGSLSFDEPNAFDFVIVGGGAEVMAIHASPGLVHTVVLKRQGAE